MSNSEVFSIIAERNSPSDESFTVLSVNYQNGEKVVEGSVLLEVEGAKAVFEIVAPKSGYFYTNLNEGDIPDVGDVIGYISKEEVADISLLIEKSNKKEASPKNTENNISKPALEYIEENSIDLNSIKSLLPTKGLVTKESIIEIMKKSSGKKNYNEHIFNRDLQKKWAEKIKELEGLEQIYFIGGGYGAIQVLDIIYKQKLYQPIGYFADDDSILDLIGINRLGEANIESIKKIGLSNKINKVLITVSNLPEFRSKFIELENDEFELVSLIHESAVIGENVEIGNGTIIFGNVHIGADSKIGKCSFISSNSSIEHHNTIGEAFCCGPSFNSSGIIKIGDRLRAGIDVSIEPNIDIGNDVTLASGTVITKNIENNKIVKKIN